MKNNVNGRLNQVSPRLRPYAQVCPIATALDVLGDRWTLLIVRDLMLGPRRYTDLQRGLPGIPPDVLTTRLRHLESAGLIAARELPPPASRRVYELTADGSEVLPVLLALGRWGWSRMEEPSDPEDLVLGRVLMSCLIDPAPTADSGVWEMWVDEEPVTVTVNDGRLTIEWGECTNPDASVRMTTAVLWSLVRGRLGVEKALAGGGMGVEGDQDSARALIDVLRHPAASTDNTRH